MLSRVLTELAAAMPSTVKYRMRGLKPLYTSMLAWRQPVIPVQTRVGQIIWNIDQLTNQQYLRGLHEPYMQECFLKFLRSGSIVYDVGAHSGFHSLFCGLITGPTGRVIAFEPDPVCVESLTRQVAANPHLCISIMPVALSDRVAKLRFLSCNGNGQSRIHPQGDVSVQATTIDILVGGGVIPAPDAIKIDVEGYEGAVLIGAKETLLRHRPLVLCDYNDATTPDTIQKLLRPLGYRVLGEFPVIGIAA